MTVRIIRVPVRGATRLERPQVSRRSSAFEWKALDMSKSPSAVGGAAKACVACRRVKMKCRLLDDSTVCERCQRKSFECTFVPHQRGRRSKTKQRTLSSGTQVATIASIPQYSADNSPIDHSGTRECRRYSDPLTMSDSNTTSTFDGIWKTSPTFRPFDILNEQATSGQYSLRNVLSTTRTIEDGVPMQAAGIDPINMGIVNFHIADSLFNGFMDKLNPYICQLDPALHSLEHVRALSSFLLTAILAAAAKTFNPAFHRPLKDHAENLLCDCFRRGEKSTEIVQAILILTYWKELDDTRAWILVGYAIRMGIELGWHNIAYSEGINTPSDTELERLNVRNRERTWLVLFVYE